MATLYELNADLQRVIEGGLVFDSETGEILFDASNLHELEAAFDDKIEACACFIKNLDADAAAIKAEEVALAERRKVLEHKAERMRGYVLDVLRQNDRNKFTTARCELSTRKSFQVFIEDESVLPAAYISVKTTKQPNKAEIRRALKHGETVAGASLVECANLLIK